MPELPIFHVLMASRDRAARATDLLRYALGPSHRFLMSFCWSSIYRFTDLPIFYVTRADGV